MIQYNNDEDNVDEKIIRQYCIRFIFGLEIKIVFVSNHTHTHENREFHCNEMGKSVIILKHLVRKCLCHYISVCLSKSVCVCK